MLIGPNTSMDCENNQQARKDNYAYIHTHTHRHCSLFNRSHLSMDVHQRIYM
ncbi:hypothetical protein TCAL_01632, partial [Tigriopus californicus]